jgi:ubiquinone/menaquinone biosynthesis C-methylase UbiE
MDTVNRFTNRAEYYARNRPGYPAEVITVLERETGLFPEAVIADIGAGTGISSELFLRHGSEVWAVEPNADMRAVAESLCSTYRSMHIKKGTAEHTGLPDASVDLVVAATAFHWFDANSCRTEFRRILKPGGYVVLLWNERRSEASPFLRAYEEVLLRLGTDYKNRWGKQRRRISDSVSQFFSPSPFGTHLLPNSQHLDFEGLCNRALSSSYAPLPGDPNHEPMLAALREIFDRFEAGGRVTMEYETAIYWGQLLGDS